MSVEAENNMVRQLAEEHKRAERWRKVAEGLDEALKLVQWESSDDWWEPYTICAHCRNDKTRGHYDGCEVEIALSAYDAAIKAERGGV